MTRTVAHPQAQARWWQTLSSTSTQCIHQARRPARRQRQWRLGYTKCLCEFSRASLFFFCGLNISFAYKMGKSAFSILRCHVRKMSLDIYFGACVYLKTRTHMYFTAFFFGAKSWIGSPRPVAKTVTSVVVISINTNVNFYFFKNPSRKRTAIL